LSAFSHGLFAAVMVPEDIDQQKNKDNPAKPVVCNQ
jgi:hypothetical protein